MQGGRGGSEGRARGRRAPAAAARRCRRQEGDDNGIDQRSSASAVDSRMPRSRAGSAWCEARARAFSAEVSERGDAIGGGIVLDGERAVRGPLEARRMIHRRAGRGNRPAAAWAVEGLGGRNAPKPSSGVQRRPGVSFVASAATPAAGP